MLSPSAVAVSSLVGRDTIAADLGVYYTASTVPGVGALTHAVNTTFVETKAIFHCYNGGALTIYPTFLRLTNVIISVGNTQVQFATTLDQGNRFSSYASGGAALAVVNQNMASQNLSGAQISGGAVVLTAATANRRLLGNRAFRPSVIGRLGDVYQFSYGSGELVDPSALPVDGTNIANVMYVMPPVVVPPGQSFDVIAWGATFSQGVSYEYEFGFVEK
jgi:hypothetical protein